MEEEEVEKTLFTMNLELDLHKNTLAKITSIFKDTAKVLEKHQKAIDFLTKQLIDMMKKVNESLMIANAYERKQIRMERQLKDFLENLEE